MTIRMSVLSLFMVIPFPLLISSSSFICFFTVHTLMDNLFMVKKKRLNAIFSILLASYMWNQISEPIGGVAIK